MVLLVVLLAAVPVDLAALLAVVDLAVVDLVDLAADLVAVDLAPVLLVRVVFLVPAFSASACTATSI